jgi:hypothetical protein
MCACIYILTASFSSALLCQLRIRPYSLSYFPRLHLQVRAAERSRQQWRDRPRRLGSLSPSPAPLVHATPPGVGSPAGCSHVSPVEVSAASLELESSAGSNAIGARATADVQQSEGSDMSDARVAALAASKEADDVRIVGIGHSMGGCVFLLYTMA